MFFISVSSSVFEWLCLTVKSRIFFWNYKVEMRYLTMTHECDGLFWAPIFQPNPKKPGIVAVAADNWKSEKILLEWSSKEERKRENRDKERARDENKSTILEFSARVHWARWNDNYESDCMTRVQFRLSQEMRPAAWNSIGLMARYNCISYVLQAIRIESMDVCVCAEYSFAQLDLLLCSSHPHWDFRTAAKISL